MEAGVGARGALALLALALCSPGAGSRELEWYSAVVRTEYVDPATNLTVWSVSESGRFGDSSPKEGAQGLVGVPRAPGGDLEGCAPDTRFAPAPGDRGAAPWVALVARGGCTFKDKVLVAARRNASAVVVYNKELYGNLTAPMSHAGEPGRARAGGGRRPSRPRGSWFRPAGLPAAPGATLEACGCRTLVPGRRRLCLARVVPSGGRHRLGLGSSRVGAGAGWRRQRGGLKDLKSAGAGLGC